MATITISILERAIETAGRNIARHSIGDTQSTTTALSSSRCGALIERSIGAVERTFLLPLAADNATEEDRTERIRSSQILKWKVVMKSGDLVMTWLNSLADSFRSSSMSASKSTCIHNA